MSHDTTIEPAGQRSGRERKGTVLTDRLCETPVAKRRKYYDRRTRGLYVSITPAGAATFSCNFTNAAGRATSRVIGIYHPETFKVANARAEVAALKAKGGAAIGETLHRQKVKAVKQGITVDQLIEKRIEFMRTPDKKDDGETRPLIESCENVARHLHNLVSPRLGHMIAREVTPDDIATLSNDIVAGKYVVAGKARKPSISNSRHMRRACSAMFKWAMEAGNRFVDANPCVNLPKLKRERPKTRVPAFNRP
jgi:hypothetical protein